MIRASLPKAPPGKRIGQGGVAECDHPKTHGPLNGFGPEGLGATRFGDVCPTCGWKDTVDGGAFLKTVAGFARKP